VLDLIFELDGVRICIVKQPTDPDPVRVVERDPGDGAVILLIIFSEGSDYLAVGAPDTSVKLLQLPKLLVISHHEGSRVPAVRIHNGYDLSGMRHGGAGRFNFEPPNIETDDGVRTDRQDGIQGGDRERLVDATWKRLRGSRGREAKGESRNKHGGKPGGFESVHHDRDLRVS